MTTKPQTGSIFSIKSNDPRALGLNQEVLNTVSKLPGSVLASMVLEAVRVKDIASLQEVCRHVSSIKDGKSQFDDAMGNNILSTRYAADALRVKKDGDLMTLYKKDLMIGTLLFQPLINASEKTLAGKEAKAYMDSFFMMLDVCPKNESNDYMMTCLMHMQTEVKDQKYGLTDRLIASGLSSKDACYQLAQRYETDLNAKDKFNALMQNEDVRSLYIERTAKYIDYTKAGLPFLLNAAENGFNSNPKQRELEIDVMALHALDKHFPDHHRAVSFWDPLSQEKTPVDRDTFLLRYAEMKGPLHDEIIRSAMRITKSNFTTSNPGGTDFEVLLALSTRAASNDQPNIAIEMMHSLLVSSEDMLKLWDAINSKKDQDLFLFKLSNAISRGYGLPSTKKEICMGLLQRGDVDFNSLHVTIDGEKFELRLKDDVQRVHSIDPDILKRTEGNSDWSAVKQMIAAAEAKKTINQKAPEQKKAAKPSV